MRKIEFIAPVEAMRGNLSGDQRLTYPTQNNAAWDAPEGKRSYATNYRPTYIGAKRSADGKTYFATKRRQAVKMSDAMRLQMAVLSVSSVIANIVSSNLTLIAGLEERYYQAAPAGWTFKHWLMDCIKEPLKSKRHLVFAGTTLAPIFVKNPYINSTAPSTATDISADFPQDLLVKFWMQLANDAISYRVNSLTGIAYEGDTFDDLSETNRNVLNLAESTAIGGSTYVVIRDTTLYLIAPDGTYPKWTDDIDSIDYQTTFTPPTA